MNVSVVVPVYNGEAHLQELITRLGLVLPTTSHGFEVILVNDRLGLVLPTTSHGFEVILVNDGSRDRSWDLICFLAKEYSWVLGIDLLRNYGQHNALLAGIRATQYEVIVTMDDDLQHPPEEIPELLNKLKECDLVYAVPQIRQHNWRRVLGSKLMRVALSALGDPYSSRRSSYRAFRAQLRDSFAQDHNPRVVIDSLLSMSSPKIASVLVHHDERRVGKSNYSFLKLVFLAIRILERLAIRRLRNAGVTGSRIVPPISVQPSYIVRELTERKVRER